MISKEQINEAARKLRDADNDLARIKQEARECRNRAYDLVQKINRTATVSGSVAEQAARISELVAEQAHAEVELKHWKRFHSELIRRYEQARVHAIACEEECQRITLQFWNDRVSAQVIALWRSVSSELKDIYGSVFQMRGRSSPNREELIRYLLQHMPDVESLKPGIAAAERVIGEAPKSEALTDQDRNPGARSTVEIQMGLPRGKRLDPIGIAAPGRAEDIMTSVQSMRSELSKLQKKIEETPLPEINEKGHSPESVAAQIRAIASLFGIVGDPEEGVRTLRTKRAEFVARAEEMKRRIADAENDALGAALEYAKLEAVKE